MKILFIADTESNAGPANVNKEIYRQLVVLGVSVTNVNRMSLRNVMRASFCFQKYDCIIVDGFDRLILLIESMARFFNKKFIALMHGDLAYENDVNNLGLKSSYCRLYQQYLKKTTAILVLTDYQRQFFLERYSFLKNKVFTCPMGIKRTHRDHIKDSEIIKVAVSGGTRPIKRNDFIARVVELLHSSGEQIELVVYGRDYSGSRDFIEKGICDGYLIYRGQVPNEVFLDELRKIDVFVMASLHEPFGISAIDALQSGASVLLSDHCGAVEALSPRGVDLILNSDKEIDVADKIKKLIVHPNAKRLVKTINYERYNWTTCVTELINVVKSL